MANGVAATSVPVVAQQARPVVLVVDDDPVNRYVVTLMLTKMGCDSHEVAGGAAAIEAYRASPYDVVLMDVAMPGVNGLDATRSIRADEQISGKRVPIFGVSGYVSEADRRDGFTAGMDEYLTKPIDLHQASLIFQRWLPGRCVREICKPDDRR